MLLLLFSPVPAKGHDGAPRVAFTYNHPRRVLLLEHAASAHTVCSACVALRWKETSSTVLWAAVTCIHSKCKLHVEHAASALSPVSCKQHECEAKVTQYDVNNKVTQ